MDKEELKTRCQALRYSQDEKEVEHTVNTYLEGLEFRELKELALCLLNRNNFLLFRM